LSGIQLLNNSHKILLSILKSTYFMTTAEKIWVIGHEIQPITSSGNYDIFFGETPSGVPGPPAHHHSKYTEFVMVLKGQMEFIVNGEKRLLQEGDSINLPVNSVHTFNNPTTDTSRWLNIHSPKGFFSFFERFGVPTKQEHSFESSVSGSMIDNVVKEAAGFDMIIAEAGN
jgi:mannose-6-phosphate isomerase-like protein (cupin superfamily)